ncbi:MAG TPA: DUF748 domain-containing protein [Burkholderiales bacterium]|nr:DUF748 domain-containing protein [Burkholderiales bacterium]
MKQTFTRILRSRWFLIGAGLLVAYALAGFLLLPWLVQRYVPEYARDSLQRQASIGKVRINPFLFTFEANDLRLAERDGTPIVGVRRLFVDFETVSLLRWAWVFANIDIDGLDLNVVTLPDGQLNLVRLARASRGKEPPAPKKEGAAPVRMVLRHVVLSEGRVSYTDRSDPSPASATLTPVNLEFDDVSTLPERKGPYTIQALLPGGGTVRWRGEVSLRPVASEGVLSITQFRPANVWRFLQNAVRLDLPEGTVDFVTHYRFLLDGGKPQLLLDGAALTLADLSLRQPGAKQPLLSLHKVEVGGAGFDLQRREVTVPKVDISDGLVTAAIARDGTLDWQTITVPKAKPAAAPAAAPAAGGEPWRVRFDGLRVADVGIQVSDQTRAAPLTLEVGKVALQAKAQLEIAGTGTRVTSNDLHLALSRIALARPSDKTPFATLDDVTLEGDSIDTGKRNVGLRELSVRGGEARIARDAQGNIDPVASLTARERAQAPAAEAGPAWHFRLGEFKLSGFKLALADRGFEPAVGYGLADVSVTLKNLSDDLHAPVPFEAALKVAQGGSLGATGSFVPDGSAADAQLKLTGISLVPLQPVVARYATLTIKSGSVSASAALKYRASKSRATLRADGALGVAGLEIDEAQGGDRFLSWKSLSATGIRFRLAPDRLTINEIRLRQPGAKITVFKDRSVNLATAFKKQETPSKADSGTSNPFPVSIERVRVEHGTVDFSDLSLVLPFAAQVRELGGVATGISSDPASRAEMKLEGRVDQTGLARVDGALSPFAPKRFMDLRTVFRNVELVPMTPYSATFAGRKIASGRLSLDLEYKIKDGKLEGNNRVLLDKFTLGERVEAPNALHLPLDLAIALLTDSQGRIDVAVPVSGDVNNPKFSYGHLIWQAIATVIKNIVTAPFRALGALLGGGATKLDAIAFDPGSARVLPTELDKLKKVAEALKQRPKLEVIADGRYSQAVDGKALRSEHVRRELAAEQKVKLAPGEEPGPVPFDNAKTQRALEKLMTARAGNGAMAQFTAAFEKKAGRKASRVNPALALFGKGSDDREFYEALYRRLVELHPLPGTELEALGQQRAAAVSQALVKDAGVDAARVAVGKTEATAEAPEDMIETKLRLDVLGAKP